MMSLDGFRQKIAKRIAFLVRFSIIFYFFPSYFWQQHRVDDVKLRLACVRVFAKGEGLKMDGGRGKGKEAGWSARWKTARRLLKIEAICGNCLTASKCMSKAAASVLGTFILIFTCYYF